MLTKVVFPINTQMYNSHEEQRPVCIEMSVCVLHTGYTIISWGCGTMYDDVSIKIRNYVL